jgi:hypothetical protein
MLGGKVIEAASTLGQKEGHRGHTKGWVEKVDLSRKVPDLELHKGRVGDVCNRQRQPVVNATT